MMIAEDSCTLPILSNLLNEFYSGSVEQDRRKSIQNTLAAFERRPSAWRICLQHLRSTTDQYVSLFCLGLIEKFIITHWATLTAAEKFDIQHSLQQYLFHRLNVNEPFFLITKATKNLTHIACFDWPQNYPSFADDLISHLKLYLDSNDICGVTFALLVLKCALEQLCNPHDAFAPKRKIELKQSLVELAVPIYDALICTASFLISSELLNSTTANLDSILRMESNPRLINVVQAAFQLGEELKTSSAERDRLRNTALVIWLECTNECIQTLPVDTRFRLDFYSAFYICSVLGSSTVSSVNSARRSCYSHPAHCLARIRIASLDCIQAIVERKDLSWEQMVSHLQYVFPIIQWQMFLLSGPTDASFNHAGMAPTSRNPYNVDLTTEKQNASNAVECRLRVTEILRLLMTNFFYNLSTGDRLTSRPLNTLDFLISLHHFTFSSPDLENYFMCLHLWSSYFEYVRMHSPSWNSSPVLLDTFAAFAKTLFSRLFFKESSTFLDRLEVEEEFPGLESDDQTVLFSLEEINLPKSTEASQFQQFLQESLQTLNVVLSLIPDVLSTIILERYCSNHEEYCAFLQSSGLLTQDFCTIPPYGQRLNHVHWVVRDFATILQTVSSLFEHLRFDSESSTNVGSPVSCFAFLQSLIGILRLSHQVSTRLACISDKSIRSDLIQVVVQNVLTIEALVLGNHIGLHANADSNKKIILSTSHCSSITFELLRFVETILLPHDSTRFSMELPIPLQLCATRLFRLSLNSVLDQPVREATFRELSQNNPTLTFINKVFNKFLAAICDATSREQVTLHLLRPLLHSFIQFFASEAVCNHYVNDPQNSPLLHFLRAVYLPYLDTSLMARDPGCHLKFLGLLNHALSSLNTSSSVSRRSVQTMLQESSILDRIFQCTTLAIESSVNNDHFYAIRLRFCSAHLTFLCTLVSSLSHSGSADLLIPSLIGKLVCILSDHAHSGVLPVSIIDGLLDIFLTLAKNRRLFVSLLGDLIDLCNHRLLLDLTSAPSKFSHADAEQLVCEASQTNPWSLQKLYSLLFVVLLDGFPFFFSSNGAKQGQRFPDVFTPVANRYTLERPAQFNQIIRIFIAAFLEQQTNSELLTFVLTKFHSLHALRKFYDLPAFSEVWLPETMRRLLNMVFNKQHDSQRDLIIDTLYHLALSSVLPTGINTTDRPKGFAFFVHEFLPAYLRSLKYVQPSDQLGLTSLFTSPLGESMTLEDFTRAIEQLATTLHHLTVLRGEQPTSFPIGS